MTLDTFRCWPLRMSSIASGLPRTCSRAPYCASPGNNSRNPPTCSTKNRLVLFTDCSRTDAAANSPTSLDSVFSLSLVWAFLQLVGHLRGVDDEGAVEQRPDVLVALGFLSGCRFRRIRIVP